MAVAALLVIGYLTGAAGPAGAATRAPVLEILPVSQFFALTGARAAESPSGASFAPNGPIQSPRLIEAGNWTDVKGHDMPLRHGNTSFGFVKMSTKHNCTTYLSSKRLCEAAPTRTTTTDELDAYVGVIFYHQNPAVNQTIIVGGTYDKYSYALVSNSPDGRPVGVLTGYCANTDTQEAAQQCLSWVNTY